MRPHKVTPEVFKNVKWLKRKRFTDEVIADTMRLSETTVRKIKKARTYAEYLRRQKIETYNRRLRKAQAEKERRRKENMFYVAAFIVYALVVAAVYIVESK